VSENTADVNPLFLAAEERSVDEHEIRAVAGIDGPVARCDGEVRAVDG